MERVEKTVFLSALQDYAQALRLKPELAVAYFNRGNARRDKGDVEGAQRDYDEATRLGYKPKESGDLRDGRSPRSVSRSPRGCSGRDIVRRVWMRR